ncbi:MAG: shikimate dehydrogenase [Thermoplasmata archaeon]|nr:MAG: shikimate dehydrogenase [Thermoplasmata archaeon]
MKRNDSNSKKRICGIIGKPLKHTLSPKMHNAAFKKLGLDYVYDSFEIEESELANTMKNLKKRNFRGLSVTLPFKIKVMEHLDDVDELAEDLGAVNTIVNDEGKLTGYNTDSPAAVEAIRRNKIDLEHHMTILILGAGGAARAIALPLARMGKDVVIANRTFERARELATKFKSQGTIKVNILDDIEEIIEDVDMIINCTPVGMKGGPQGSPISPELLRKDIIVFDMVYSPKNTELVLAAQKSGAKVIYGYEMFIYQGVMAFEKWTCESAPIDVMQKVVLDALDTEK